MYKSLFYVAALWGSFVNISLAVSTVDVLPVGYSFDQPTFAKSGFFYSDDTGDQLIDGIYGVYPYWSDQGNGKAYEWVTWYQKPAVNIDFDFGSASKVDTIEVGSIQENLSDAVLPSIKIYSGTDGTSWNLVDSLLIPENDANNGMHHTLALSNLGINAQYIRVALEHSLDGPFTMVDEVDFSMTTPLPPAVWLFGSALAGLALTRRAKSK